MWPIDSLPELPEVNVHSYIGVVVAIVGNILISVALNIQKYAHNQLLLQQAEPKPLEENLHHQRYRPLHHPRSAAYQQQQRAFQQANYSGRNTPSHAFENTLQSASEYEEDDSDQDRTTIGRTDDSEDSDEEASLGGVYYHQRHNRNQGNFNRDAHVYDSPDEDDNGGHHPLLAQQHGDQYPLHSVDPPTSRATTATTSTNGSRERVDKTAVEKANAQGNDGNTGEAAYLKSKAWWLGMTLMILGECGNFLAYGFAPASLVAPLGTVALVSNVILAPLMLREPFRSRDLGGIVVAIIGTIVVVVNSKSDEVKLTPEAMLEALMQPQFLIYFIVCCIAVATLATLSDTIGPDYILIDLSVVAIFGGYTVLATKGVSSLLSLSFYKMFTYPIAYLLVFVLVSTAVLQIKFLNRSLQRFDSTQVIPTQFVLFTISAIVGSAILYNDFSEMDFNKCLHFLTGCCMTFLGVFFITSQRDKVVQITSPGGDIVATNSEWILASQHGFFAHDPARRSTIDLGQSGNAGGVGGAGIPNRSNSMHVPDSLPTHFLSNKRSQGHLAASFNGSSGYTPYGATSIGVGLGSSTGAGSGVGGSNGGKKTSTSLLPVAIQSYQQQQHQHHSPYQQQPPYPRDTAAGSSPFSITNSVHNVFAAVGSRHTSALGLDKVVENYLVQRNEERRASVSSSINVNLHSNSNIPTNNSSAGGASGSSAALLQRPI